MALDVYLVVFHHFDGRALKRLEIFYAVTITVLTFIPALVFLFIHTSARGPVYDGSAIVSVIPESRIENDATNVGRFPQIWCAIGVNWTLLRLLIYYVPAWYELFPVTTFHACPITRTSSHRITIVVIMLVYCFVGIKIWILHSDIQLASDDYIPQATSSTTSQRSNKTTCTINTNITATTVESQGPNEPRRSADLREIATQPPLELSSIPRLPTPVQPTPPRQRRLSFRQYILIPMLFFFALLATWVAPTVYRVYLFGQPDYVSYSLLMVVSALTSLRGFFNAIIFLTMGMKGRRRRISECPRAAMASDNRLNP